MKISVVTVAYNAEATIAHTIASVNAQAFEDVQHIIIDGGSSDGTVAIARDKAGPGSLIVSEPDKGIYDAMNKGARLASGDLIGFLNADDFFARTDALNLLARAAQESQNAAAVGGAVALVDALNTRRVQRYYRAAGYDRWMLRFGHMPPHPGFYVRRAALDQVGEFDAQMRTGADFEWMLRFFHVHKLAMRPIEQTLVGFRLGGATTSGLESLRTTNREILASCRRWNLRSNSAATWGKYVLKVAQFVRRPPDYPLAPPLGWQPQ